MKQVVILSVLLLIASPIWAASTADPNATTQAKALYDYLVNLSDQADHKMITGQMIWRDMVADEIAKHAGTPRPPIDYALPQRVFNQTGQYPGLIGMLEPYQDDGTAFRFTIDYWNAGGLIMSHSLIGNRPEKWFGKDNVNLDTITYDPRYIDFLNQLVAAYRHFESHDVVLIVRPFLEMNGPWNWFYTSDYQKYKNLWIHFFNYMTSHGVHNLLYMYCPSAGQGTYLERYPGDQYVDIVGLDSYEDLEGQPFHNNNTIDGYEVMVATGKPFAIGEYGAFSSEPPYSYLTKDADLLLEGLNKKMPKIIWVMHWSPPFNITQMSHATNYMNNPYVQNRPVPYKAKEGDGRYQ